MRREHKILNHKILDDWLFSFGIFVSGIFFVSIVGADTIDDWAATTGQAVSYLF